MFAYTLYNRGSKPMALYLQIGNTIFSTESLPPLLKVLDIVAMPYNA